MYRITSLALLLFLICIDPRISYGQGLTIDQSFIIEECCTLGSYDKGDISQFILKSPISLVIEDFSTSVGQEERDDISRFEERVAQATSSHIDVNAPLNANIPFSTKLGIMIMPSKKSDLTPFEWTSLRDQFGFMQDSTMPGSTEKGIEGLIEKMYSVDDDAIGHARGDAVGGVKYAVMFVKPKSRNDLVKIIKRGILEGMGYNVDDRQIDGTIFSAGNAGDLTPDDEVVLKELYTSSK